MKKPKHFHVDFTNLEAELDGEKPIKIYDDPIVLRQSHGCVRGCGAAEVREITLFKDALRISIHPLPKDVLTCLYNSFLNQTDYKVNDIILFGSRARGDFRDDSDFDFAIIAQFDNEEMRDFFSLRAWRGMGRFPTDFLYIHPDRLARENVGICGILKREGVSILREVRNAGS